MSKKGIRDGTIVRVPECHCYHCSDGAMGLAERDPTGDLKRRGWHRIDRRWHCPVCSRRLYGLPAAQPDKETT